MALTDNLISYWKLDEASGNALDAHGSNTLTETSGTIDAATGKITGARDFEAGDTEYFTRADNADLSTGDIDFSFAGWINPETTVNRASILAKGSGTSSATDEYVLRFNNTARLEWVIGKADASGYVVATATTFGALSAGTWYWFYAQHDAANNLCGVSVNNGTIDTAAITGGPANSTSAFFIGAGVVTTHLWDGLICEVGFWKRLLTSDERTALYNGGAGLAYPFSSGGHPAARRLWHKSFRPVEVGREGVVVI